MLTDIEIAQANEMEKNVAFLPKISNNTATIRLRSPLTPFAA